MNVTKSQIIARGLSNRCPNCGAHSLFPPRSFRIHPRCPSCGLSFDRGKGFYLGPWVLNYTFVVFGFVLPSLVLGARGAIPWGLALTLAIFGCVCIPLLIYRWSWSWWLALYFYFLPGSLPANGGPLDSTEDD